MDQLILYKYHNTKTSVTVIRPDFILSYWVFVWYLAYLMGWTNASPKLLFAIGILENLATMAYIWGHATLENMIYFVVVFLLTKILPFATLWKVPITKRDVTVSVAVLAIYGIWVYLHRKQIPMSTVQSLRENRNLTPGIWLFHQLKQTLLRIRTSIGGQIKINR